jgi:hypothetical protein
MCCLGMWASDLHVFTGDTDVGATNTMFGLEGLK